MSDIPMLLSKQKAIKLMGIGKNLFAQIEADLPFVRFSKQKKYHRSDIENIIESNKNKCTPRQSKTRKTVTTSTLLSHCLESAGLDAVVTQTIRERQTSTH